MSSLMSPLRRMRPALPPEFLLNVAELIENEGEWVECHGPAPKNCRELLDAYGLDDAGLLDTYEIDASGKTTDAIVVVMLDNNASWGEFIGGVLATLPHMPKSERDVVLPMLMQAVATAAREGVDH